MYNKNIFNNIGCSQKRAAISLFKEENIESDYENLFGVSNME